jgi:hypothetical protein
MSRNILILIRIYNPLSQQSSFIFYQRYEYNIKLVTEEISIAAKNALKVPYMLWDWCILGFREIRTCRIKNAVAEASISGGARHKNTERRIVL